MSSNSWVIVVCDEESWRQQHHLLIYLIYHLLYPFKNPDETDALFSTSSVDSQGPFPSYRDREPDSPGSSRAASSIGIACSIGSSTDGDWSALEVDTSVDGIKQ